jgi:hypothetical protein
MARRAATRDRRTATAGERIARWSAFGVVVALLPFLFDYVGELIGHDTHPTFENVFGRGDLLLLTAAIDAAAIGEVVARRSRSQLAATMQVVAAAGCACLVAVASFGYAVVSPNVGTALASDPKAVGWFSIAIFGFSVFSAGCCVALSEAG